MKPRHLLAGLTLAALLIAAGGKAHAQVTDVHIAIDENGNGTLQFNSSPMFPLNGMLAPDPGPGGLLSALTFDLHNPPSLVAGDVILNEPVVTLGPVLSDPVQSDLVRFNPAGTGGVAAYPASVVFYSDLSDTTNALADTGFPLSTYTNLLTFTETGTEGDDGFLYTPTAGQPGFVTGFNVTYRIVSDGVVPEPGSLALLAIGATTVGLAAARARRRRRAAGASLPASA